MELLAVLLSNQIQILEGYPDEISKASGPVVGHCFEGGHNRFNAFRHMVERPPSLTKNRRESCGWVVGVIGRNSRMSAPQ